MPLSSDWWRVQLPEVLKELLTKSDLQHFILSSKTRQEQALVEFGYKLRSMAFRQSMFEQVQTDIHARFICEVTLQNCHSFNSIFC